MKRSDVYKTPMLTPYRISNADICKIDDLLKKEFGIMRNRGMYFNASEMDPVCRTKAAEITSTNPPMKIIRDTYNYLIGGTGFSGSEVDKLCCAIHFKMAPPKSITTTSSIVGPPPKSITTIDDIGDQLEAIESAMIQKPLVLKFSKHTISVEGKNMTGRSMTVGYKYWKALVNGNQMLGHIDDRVIELNYSKGEIGSYINNFGVYVGGYELLAHLPAIRKAKKAFVIWTDEIDSNEMVKIADLLPGEFLYVGAENFTEEFMKKSMRQFIHYFTEIEGEFVRFY